jgi:hypothetical protein
MSDEIEELEALDDVPENADELVGEEVEGDFDPDEGTRMTEFFLAPALVKLRDEVNVRFPNRDKASDGWIGDPSHAARKSDHNPCWDCSGRYEGIVRALDIDISPDGRPNVDLRRRLLKNTVGDHRVWYVISNGIIYSRTHGWTPLRYTGENGHFQHVHISLNGANGVDPSGNFDTSNWFPKPKPKEPEPGEDRIENFRDSRPNWDVKILDRIAKRNHPTFRGYVNDIERIVDNLPDDRKDTRVKEFKETFEEKRILKMSLLNEAVKDGRMHLVKNQRDKLNAVIKKVLR